MKKSIKDFNLLKIENLQSIKGGIKASGLVSNPLHTTNNNTGTVGGVFDTLD